MAASLQQLLRTLFLAALFLLTTTPHGSAEPQISDEKNTDFFETFIRPTLVADCMECHGAEKQKGGLRLDSRAGWLAGGDSGPSIIPFQPDKSLLLRTIKHLEPELEMPQKAPKLEDSIIANFTRWIAIGAPDPRDSPPTSAATANPSWPELLAARRSWWALQPITHPSPPQSSLLSGSPPPTSIAPYASEQHQNVHPVDLFLNDAISRAGLTPASPASAAVLARRLHFLLIGLPPSPADIASFSKAHAENPSTAVRQRTRELLASPAFGEHWARHWMDLVRYADSHGSEGDPEIPFAYQYRDYLIRAFNSDTPLDQLIREHLAGDLLSNPRISSVGINESRIGPAHFRLGEHGFQPVDTLDEQVKTVDNQIDVVTKAFLGLTVSCARCHDHKFDPISQRDYTALYGIFSSVRPAQLVIDSADHLQLPKIGALARLKNVMRQELATHWLSQLQRLPETLRQNTRGNTQSTLTDLTEMQARLQSLQCALNEKLWKSLSPQTPRYTPAPCALWNFHQNAEDQFGRVRSELQGSAKVENGALVLDGKNAYLKSSPLPFSVTERTLEAWLTTANVEQHGGGIVSIEQVSVHHFDSIVYAEKQKYKWLAGSENHRRTQQTDGTAEEAKANERIHIAITYQADGTISMFRNGQPYGQPYKKDVALSYFSGDAQLLIGLRHTGAANGFFEGRIEEIRLYSRALSNQEIECSFREGPLGVTLPTTQGFNHGTHAELKPLITAITELQAEIARLTPENNPDSIATLTAAPLHPLHLAVRAAHLDPDQFAAFHAGYRSSTNTLIGEAKKFNAESISNAWNLAVPELEEWFTNGPDIRRVSCGDFRIAAEGEHVFKRLLPAGIAASSLVPHFGGVATSPEFTVKTGSISIRFAATNGAMLRLIPNNYPLGSNSIFPRAIVNRDNSAWTRLDTSYRVNTSSYIELTTPGHQTRRVEAPKGAAPFDANNAFFVLENVLFHEGKEPPKELHPALELLLSHCHANDAETFLAEMRDLLQTAVQAWRDNRLSEAQRELLDACIQCQILSTHKTATPALDSALAEYRVQCKAMPSPQFAPGVLEHRANNAPFLPRGDHKKPGDRVPRAFLEVLDSSPINSSQSGRLELAERLLAPTNPLTARVMANRIWYWTFGTGIVPTVDNFGRMGEKPSHPELLDFLATELQTNNWSLKKSLEFLVLTEAFQRESLASNISLEKDPANALLSHANLRRLEAESIRDALLSVSGALDPRQFGPSVAANVPRRSIYVLERRNSLPPLLTAFDAPKPFTTLGRRDVTTVPAQSLMLLNNPEILQLARRWSDNTRARTSVPEDRIRSMFEVALGRLPSIAETARALEFLSSMNADAELTPLGHALFNLKEFVYLK